MDFPVWKRVGWISHQIFPQPAGAISVLCLFGNICHPQGSPSPDCKSFWLVGFVPPAPFGEGRENQHKNKSKNLNDQTLQVSVWAAFFGILFLLFLFYDESIGGI